MKATTQSFGYLPDGREIKIFHFVCDNGFSISITNYGATITSIRMPDKYGTLAEITAGFSTLEDYLKGHPHFGAIAGRFANRIGKGRFRIKNTEYHLPLNDGINHLHGGTHGFHTRRWDYQLLQEETKSRLILSYTSPDLEEGYPGNLKAAVTYTLYNNNELSIRYEATTDKETHINLTNHAYYNLGGFKENIYDHHLRLHSDFYLEMDAANIPTGKLLPCQDTKLNFNEDVLLDGPVKDIPGGLDHCFVLSQARNTEEPIAWLSHRPSGRQLTVYTSQPSIQVYSGNNLDGQYTGHNQTNYRQHSAICLETQHYPDSPNQPLFPSTLLKPGSKYDNTARFVFDVIK